MDILKIYSGLEFLKSVYKTNKQKTPAVPNYKNDVVS